jgi:catechol 2,3-dioxygenase-like lactoylglutathione lyase family enzyme
MKFGHVELFVTDPPCARDFCQHALGFELTAIQAERFVRLRLGDLEVLRPGSPPPPQATYAHARLGLVLYTSDLEDTVRRPHAQVIAVEALDEQGPCYAFRDPDGNWFQLVDPADH